MSPEVVMNLWVFTRIVGPESLFPDIDHGRPAPVSEQADIKMEVIYELGVRPYMMSGSDAEMTTLLKQLAVSDFHPAQRFPLPDRYYVSIAHDGGVLRAISGDDPPTEGRTRRGMALVRPDISGMAQMEYFKEALDAVQAALPRHRRGIDGDELPPTPLNRKNLLSVITNIRTDSDGRQRAVVDGTPHADTPIAAFNMWLFRDQAADAIYALAGRAYMVNGSDGDRKRVLEALAPNDFRMASQLPVPDRYSANVSGVQRAGMLAVSPTGQYSADLFDNETEGGSPARSSVSLLTCVVERSGTDAEATVVELVETTHAAAATASVQSEQSKHDSNTSSESIRQKQLRLRDAILAIPTSSDSPDYLEIADSRKQCAEFLAKEPSANGLALAASAIEKLGIIDPGNHGLSLLSTMMDNYRLVLADPLSWCGVDELDPPFVMATFAMMRVVYNRMKARDLYQKVISLSPSPADFRAIKMIEAEVDEAYRTHPLPVQAGLLMAYFEDSKSAWRYLAEWFAMCDIAADRHSIDAYLKVGAAAVRDEELEFVANYASVLERWTETNGRALQERLAGVPEERRRQQEAESERLRKEAEDKRKKQEAEEELRRQTDKRAARASEGKCVLCGEPLEWYRRLFGAPRHKKCATFTD